VVDSMKTKLWLGLGVIAAVGAVMTGCGSAPQPAEGHEHKHSAGSASANMDVDDYLPAAGLTELGSASDLVVRGRIVGAQGGVLIAKDPTAKYTVFTVRVAEVLKGAKAASVKVALLTEIGGGRVQVEGRPAVVVGDDGIWLLKRIAPEFNYRGYVLTNQQSLLVVQEGKVVAGSADTTVGREVADLQTVDRVLNRLR
jgi:hypothetical protein